MTVRRATRFLFGVALGGGALLAYLHWVGTDTVIERATAVAPWALGAVFVLVVAEGLVDGIGMWASVKPLGEGFSAGQAAQFALAGDFFDVLSPAGPVTSEPIMAQFIGTTTETSYSEALGVRSVAKYVKAGSQLCFSVLLGLVVVAGGTEVGPVLITLGGAGLALLIAGVLILRTRQSFSAGVVAVLGPILARISSLYRAEPRGKETVATALDRFWTRALAFRSTPGLLALIGVAGVLEQALTAAILWVALAGTGTPAALLPIVVVIPLPQAASVVPIPAGLGAYDLLLAGALVLVTGAGTAPATVAVLVARSLSVPFGIGAGGIAVAFLRGWRSGTE